MSWLYLLIAAIFEIGWPYGLKMASISQIKVWWIIFAIVTMILSGVYLYLAQREIPVGTAYAVWTGIGASGTFILGVLLFNDGLNMLRLLGVIFIILGVALLKISN